MEVMEPGLVPTAHKQLAQEVYHGLQVMELHTDTKRKLSALMLVSVTAPPVNAAAFLDTKVLLANVLLAQMIALDTVSADRMSISLLTFLKL